MSGEEYPDSTSVTWQSHYQDKCPPDLRFLHFNDVYHIEYVASKQFIVLGTTKAGLIAK